MCFGRCIAFAENLKRSRFGDEDDFDFTTFACDLLQLHQAKGFDYGARLPDIADSTKPFIISSIDCVLKAMLATSACGSLAQYLCKL